MRPVRGRVVESDVTAPVERLELVLPDPRESSVSERIVATGYTEREFTEYAHAVIDPGATVVDVGASVGYFTCLFAHWSGPSGTVLAFEPWPSVLPYLKANVRGNRLRNVKIDRTALFDRAGRAHMSPPSYRVTLGRSREPSAVNVRLARFDDLRVARRLRQLDAIKIDIEGAELRALVGMRRSIERWRPVLLLEVHPSFLPLYGDSLDALHRFLGEIGYDHVVVETWRAADVGHHLVAAPRDRLERLGLVPAGRPRLVFSLPGPGEWHRSPTSPLAVSALEGGAGVSFVFDLAPGDKDHALTDSWPLAILPAEPRSRGMLPERYTCARVDASVTQDANVSLWIYEYDDQRPARTRSFPIRGGSEAWSFLSSPAVRSFKLGLRFTGRGRLELRSLEIEQWGMR